MKTFLGNKSLEQIKAQCKRDGVEFRDALFKKGYDHVSLHSPKVKVVFNTVNGRFFGYTPDGIKFFSDDKRDGTPWFDALLNYFYVSKPA